MGVSVGLSVRRERHWRSIRMKGGGGGKAKVPTSFIVVFPRVYKVIGLPPPFLLSKVPQRLLPQVPESRGSALSAAAKRLKPAKGSSFELS